MSTEFKLRTSVETKSKSVNEMNSWIKFPLSEGKELEMGLEIWHIYNEGIYEDSFYTPLPLISMKDMWIKFRELQKENKDPEYNVVAYKWISPGVNDKIMAISVQLCWKEGDDMKFMYVTKTYRTKELQIVTTINNNSKCKNEIVNLIGTRHLNEMNELEKLIRLMAD